MAIVTKPIFRILLVRLSALGDCVAAVPVFMALRRRYPTAHIAWAVQDSTAPLLQGLPGLDELIIFPRRRWKNLSSRWQIFKEALRFIRRLRRRRFDLVVDVQSNSKSAGIAYCTGAKIRIGHGKGEAKEISAWLNNRLVDAEPTTKHIVMRNLHLLSDIGIEVDTPEFILPVNKLLQQKVKQALHETGFDERFILFVPFTSKAVKDWKPEQFKQLAALLSHQNIPVVFLHSPGKTQETQLMLPSSNVAPVAISPLLSIPEMTELIRFSAAVVGGDTGPTHIAGALNMPTFAFYGPTDPERLKPWGPTEVYPLEVSPEQVAHDIIDYWKIQS